MTTSLSTTTSHPVPATAARSRVLWTAGAKAALLGALAAEAVGGIARAVGVPMQAGGFGASHAEAIGVGAFATATFLNLVVGTLLAAALVRWARHPERTFRSGRLREVREKALLRSGKILPAAAPQFRHRLHVIERCHVKTPPLAAPPCLRAADRSRD